VELVQRAFDAFSKRDLTAALEVSDPDIELFAPGTAALTREGRAYCGHEGMCDYFRDVGRVWEELDVVPHDFREVGEYVLVVGRLRARGQGGLIIDEPAYWAIKIHDDRIRWAAAYTSREPALEAVGLSE
jgi:ketosteroid isomerase-like protein